MKPGIIMALLLSFAVVGWATWYRLASSAEKTSLVAVKAEEMPQAYYDELVAKFSDVSASSSPADEEPLTTTDIIGRQLISDYIGLAQSGQATDENLMMLADNYTQNIPTIVSDKKVALLDLTIVAETSVADLSYTSSIESIYQEYALSLTKAANGGALTPGKEMDSAAKKMGDIYTDTVGKLKALSVPADFSALHLELINTYLNNIAAMNALAQSSTDPATAFGGMVAYKQNADKEFEILSKIQEMATEHGI